MSRSPSKIHGTDFRNQTKKVGGRKWKKKREDICAEGWYHQQNERKVT